MHHSVTRLKELFVSFQKRVELALSFKTQCDVEDLRSLVLLKDLMNGYLPWTGSALRPSAMRLILNEVIIHRRRFVLEFGSGISTVLLSKVLAQQGGILISVDHDGQWQETVRNMIGDPPHVTLVAAEIEPVTSIQGGLEFYAMSRVIPALGGRQVDLLLVDGPIGNGAESRYPALPLLRDHLHEDCTVVLDDIDCPEERHIAERWASEFQFDLALSRFAGSLGILTPKGLRRANIF